MVHKIPTEPVTNCQKHFYVESESASFSPKPVDGIEEEKHTTQVQTPRCGAFAPSVPTCLVPPVSPEESYGLLTDSNKGEAVATPPQKEDEGHR